jgi:DNA-directed RNA polymerase subunit alpha
MMKVLRTPITDFELSVRARNCLTNMGISTLEELVSYTEADMLEWKNFGETSLSEIKRLLVQKGLRLGMRRDDGSFMVPDDFDAARSINLEEELKWMGPLTGEQKEALELQISTLNLSVRCHRALVERLNLKRIGDALLYSEEDLLGMPNFGITSLNELQLKLKDYSLRLRSGRGEEAFLG